MSNSTSDNQQGPVPLAAMDIQQGDTEIVWDNGRECCLNGKAWKITPCIMVILTILSIGGVIRALMWRSHCNSAHCRSIPMVPRDFQVIIPGSVEILAPKTNAPEIMTTTGSFVVPSTMLSTLATSVRPVSRETIKATDIYFANFPTTSASTPSTGLPAITTAAIDDLAKQAASLLEMSKAMSIFQSEYNNAMKEDLENIIMALEKKDFGAAMEVMGDMFSAMGNYEMFLEDVITDLIDQVTGFTSDGNL